jgi:hypothetical protein
MTSLSPHPLFLSGRPHRSGASTPAGPEIPAVIISCVVFTLGYSCHEWTVSTLPPQGIEHIS